MDGFVNKILSTSKEELPDLQNHLSKNEKRISQLLGDTDNALSVLSPEEHSLGYMHILFSKCYQQLSSQQMNLLMTQMRRFLSSANPEQIIYDREKFIKIACWFSKLCLDDTQPRSYFLAIKILEIASEKLELPDAITPIHVELLKHYLLTKSYRRALRVANRNALFINPSVTFLSPVNVLCYYYYTGLVFTGMKNFGQAQESFQLVFTVPANAVSSIAVEAYKKFILVSLIKDGRVPDIPKYAPPVVARTLRNIATNYLSFASSFSLGPEAVEHAASKDLEQFTKDKNFGLVRQCLKAVTKKAILRLTNTYLTLSLADIATTAKIDSPEHAEKLILEMIESGEIFASIDQENGMVRFLEDPESFNSTEISNQINGYLEQCMDLTVRLQTLQEEAICSRNYVQKQMLTQQKSIFLEGTEDIGAGV